MIRQIRDLFILGTEHTTYAFHVTSTGHLEHLYYGSRILDFEASDTQAEWAMEALREHQEFEAGNVIRYDEGEEVITLEDLCLEMSSYGKGDIREPFLEIIHSDGGRTSDFLYDHAEITSGKPEYKTLPGSYAEHDWVRHLTIFLKDAAYGLTLELHYYVYSACDVITRSCRLINDSQETCFIDRLMSMQLDLAEPGYVVSSFHGGWASEMTRYDTVITEGKHVNASFTGTSSNRSNPFMMIAGKRTSESHGRCYGINLIYSGNHYEACEVNSFGKTRIVAGINPQNFLYRLDPGEDFEAPEAVLCFSERGYGGMSRAMHTFVRQHIVRGAWKERPRPVLINSWEANYFNISEAKLLKLAKTAAEVGIELFVMDDGWFGTRDDDTQSLGDWTPNPKKLPGGLEGISRKISALGMDFGIWVEPEMVSVNSDLYRAHPDWVMEIPGKKQSEGRHQRILDLANPEVVDYMIEKMTEVFSSAKISYVKWDMNRIMSDVFSPYLTPDRQGEVAHRYVLGLYRMMKTLTERFPDILFEGCAAGGNRFDLGILCYFPQIWASDNTDAICRTKIQEGYSFGYPQSVVACHVSDVPNHQTLRVTPLETRFRVAAFGILGYECNLNDLKKEELEEIRGQVEFYKEWRDTFQFGTFYRTETGNIHQWTVVSKDKSRAAGLLLQELVQPNTQYTRFVAKGLAPYRRYRFYNRKIAYNVKGFGGLINTAAPFHIRQGSLIHNVVAKFVTMPGETEEYIVSGALLAKSGIKLLPAFSATGYNEKVRYFPDFASRLYLMEEIQEAEGEEVKELPDKENGVVDKSKSESES